MRSPGAQNGMESGWRAVAASVAGSYHEKTGRPCQDAHCWKLLSEGALIGAVADGAGSAPLAEVGATLAARVAVESLAEEETLPSGSTESDAFCALLLKSVVAARQAVAAEAQARGVTMRDLATTLLLLAATPECVAVAQIGDGAIVLHDAEQGVFGLTAPQSGEFANATNFLTDPQALDSLHVQVWRGAATHLAVFSDGLQNLALKMPEGRPHPPFFLPLFEFVAEIEAEETARAQLVAFLKSPQVVSRSDDDLTLLLAALTR